MKKHSIILSSLMSTLLTIAIISIFGFGSHNSSLEDPDEEIGTIKIWPGNPNSVPNNWRICDGTPLLKSNYPILYERIGSYWDKDQGYNKDFFRIPDLRGVFIRGANGNERDDKFREPENNQRERLYTGTNVPNNAVGSFQMDDFKSHNHELKNAYDVLSRASTTLTTQGGGNFGYKSITVDYAGGLETRPKNAYVHFIIRAK